MPSFSQRHAPPPRLLGPEIPAGVRRAIDSWLVERKADPHEIRTRIFQRAGYGDVIDVVDDVRDRWGDNEAERLIGKLEDDPTVARWERGSDAQRDAATKVIFHHLPEPLYLDYLEEAIEEYVRVRVGVLDNYDYDLVQHPILTPIEHLNNLFRTRRIDYRFTEEGKAEWHGDEGAYHEVIRPALDALDDERLAGCRHEFEAALGHLRAGTPKDREDAIEEAGKAVESAMKVLLDERDVKRPERQHAEKLWQALRDGGIVETPTHDAILSTSRLRNEWGAHGQGGEVREIPAGIPEHAVRSAAAAIAYLAGLLPGEPG
jgi:hypothetical protein